MVSELLLYLYQDRKLGCAICLRKEHSIKKIKKTRKVLDGEDQTLFY